MVMQENRSTVNFPRCRNILWDSQPDWQREEEPNNEEIDTCFLLTPEQLLSTEFAVSVDITRQIVEKTSNHVNSYYYVRAEETRSNWKYRSKYFARKILLCCLMDKPMEIKEDEEVIYFSLPLAFGVECKPSLQHVSKYKFSGKETFNLSTLFSWFPPDLSVITEEGKSFLRFKIDIPKLSFSFTRIACPRLLNPELLEKQWEHATEIGKNDDDYKFDKFGLVSMNCVRKLILYSQEDESVFTHQPVIGFWIIVESRLEALTLWMACYHFLSIKGLYERVLQDGAFLALVHNRGDQKYSVLCCNCEVQIAGQRFHRDVLVNEDWLKSVPKQTYCWTLPIPLATDESNKAYLGLPVQIYYLSKRNDAIPKAPKEDSAFVRKTNIEWKKQSMGRPLTLSEMINSNRRGTEPKQESFESSWKSFKPSLPVDLNTQHNSTQQQLKQLHEEMQSLKQCFNRLRIIPDSKMKHEDKISVPQQTVPKDNKGYVKRRPRSLSHDDASQDSFPAQSTGGYVMSPVSSATDGDPRNDFAQPLKTRTLCVPGKWTSNPWQNMNRKQKDVAVQVDMFREYNQMGNTVSFPGTRNSFKKTDVEIETEDLMGKYNDPLSCPEEGLGLTSSSGNNIAPSTCSTPHYRTGLFEENDDPTEYPSHGSELSDVQLAGSSKWHRRHIQGKRGPLSAKSTTLRRYSGKSMSTSDMEEPDDSNFFHIPKIIYPSALNSDDDTSTSDTEPWSLE